MRLPPLPPSALAALALAAAVLAGAGILWSDEPAAALEADPPYKATELFPAAPGGNAQRGYAVAVDAGWLAMGAHLEGDHDAGAVYLFEWSGTTWEQTDKLLAGPPGAQLGFSLALRGNVLAAGAPGEGAVYVFVKQVGGWVLQKRLTGKSHGARSFGRSLALGGGRLAVGAFGAHGGAAGAVYLYGVNTWDFRKMILSQAPQEDERFGAAVALKGNLLAVGAPGRDLGPHREATDAGAVYLFEGAAGRWTQRSLLSLESAASSPSALADLAGDQLGSAVALADEEIAAGAPTADVSGLNCGAVYTFVRHGARWVLGETASGSKAHDQLGTSVALSEKLLVAGAPAPPPGKGTGGIHVFRRAGASWVEQAVAPLVPGNSEVRDLSGFAVAVSGDRVAVGGVLGDQGSAAAGAAWSFRCPDGDTCAEEAEVVARDPGAGMKVGAAVTLSDKYLAVGSPRADGVHAGAVYVYRPAGNGWRQAALLTSDDPLDGFGSSVALDGERLVVGAPRRQMPPETPQAGIRGGVVFLYTRQRGSWASETGVRTDPAVEGEGFGSSVALAGDVMVIGASYGIAADRVYVAKKTGKEWPKAGEFVVADSGNNGGPPISLRDGLLAIGAPGENGGVGAVNLAAPDPEDPKKWAIMDTFRGTRGPGLTGDQGFGSSVSVGTNILVVGSPGFGGGSGAGWVFEKINAWRQVILPPLPFPKGRSLGASVALSPLADRFAVGAQDSDGSGRAFLFDLSRHVWTEIRALEPRKDDAFGSSVALSSGFAVVTSPGSERGDRVTVFTLPRENR